MGDDDGKKTSTSTETGTGAGAGTGMETHLRAPLNAALLAAGGLKVGGPDGCINAAAAAMYLDHPAVQKAIHVGRAHKMWHICGGIQYVSCTEEEPPVVTVVCIECVRVFCVCACVCRLSMELWILIRLGLFTFTPPPFPPFPSSPSSHPPKLHRG